MFETKRELRWQNLELKHNMKLLSDFNKMLCNHIQEFYQENQELKKKITYYQTIANHNAMSLEVKERDFKYINMLVAKCQKLNSENQDLRDENASLGRKNIGLAEQCKDFVFETLKLKDEIKQPESEIEIKPTYFNKNEKNKCLDLCEIINNKIKIGSLNCQECIYNKKYDLKKNWVKCSQRPEGKELQKRDQYGVVSITDENHVCSSCIYTEQNVNSIECSHCLTNNDINEYYSSK